MTKPTPEQEKLYRAMADDVIYQFIPDKVKEFEDEIWHQAAEWDIEPYYIYQQLIKKWGGEDGSK